VEAHDAVIEHVSDTAFVIAHYRAVETGRLDALFRDPLAGLLAGERGKKMAATMPMPSMTKQIVVIRTSIIDDYIQSALTEGVAAVLNIGAGLDTRPYRMEIPEELLWIEADYPHVIAFKEHRLRGEKPRCRLERVPLDLANGFERRRLFASIHERATKLLVLAEGVISYLSVEEVGPLADDLKAMAHAQYWIVEYFSPEVVKFRQRRSIGRKMRNAPFKFAPKDYFGFFAEHGWHLKEIRYLAEEADRLRRPIQFPPILKIRSLFASEKRRSAFRRFQGYGLFVNQT
jgi:methyltransferase (TIGR00027 family)